jgi:cytidylate kinase
MKIITISREFGSGGRELGKRLADRLGYDYYDSEIISAVAKNSGLDARYVETQLNEHGWRNFPVTFRGTLGSSAYMQANKVQLLIEQKKVIEEIASLGKDCVIVGRNADVLLRDYHPFTIFVCAETEAKLRRCRERASEKESFTDKELLRQMKEIDKSRARTREILSGSAWGDRASYHLTVNTSDWGIKALVPAVADFAKAYFSK